MFSPLASLLLLAGFLIVSSGSRAQGPGCTDPLATNYAASATINDGSCLYPATTLTATTLGQLSDTIRESSGLVYWDGAFWTHNDDGDTTLYAIDTADGHILKRVRIAGAQNRDWEEITQDEDYFYIGDFGNNVDGNRQDLSILRIPKSAVLAGQSVITPDKIFFRYADQVSFTPTGNNNTDFDCEAFIAGADSLYLFTKQWVGNKTRMYAFPKTPGSYVAAPRAEHDVDGLITGAVYLPARRVIALSGYKIAGFSFQPFVYLLYDFTGQHAFSGNKRKILVNPGFHQVEAITTIDGRRFYLSNEKFISPINTQAKLQLLDLSPYLSRWYGSLGMAVMHRAADTVALFPNPARSRFDARIVSGSGGKLEATIYEASGKVVSAHVFELKAGTNQIHFEPAACPPGQYLVKLRWAQRTAWGRISLL